MNRLWHLIETKRITITSTTLSVRLLMNCCLACLTMPFIVICGALLRRGGYLCKWFLKGKWIQLSVFREYTMTSCSYYIGMKRAKVLLHCTFLHFWLSVLGYALFILNFSPKFYELVLSQKDIEIGSKFSGRKCRIFLLWSPRNILDAVLSVVYPFDSTVFHITSSLWVSDSLTPSNIFIWFYCLLLLAVDVGK